MELSAPGGMDLGTVGGAGLGTVGGAGLGTAGGAGLGTAGGAGLGTAGGAGLGTAGGTGLGTAGGTGGLAAALEATPTGQRPRLDRERQCLIGSRCQVCGATSWPARAVCNRCGAAAMREVALARTGQLRTYTEVWVPRPGLEPPYVLGQVDLDGGPLIFTHVRGLAQGSRVPLPVALQIGEEGDLPPFWAQPAQTAAAGNTEDGR